MKKKYAIIVAAGKGTRMKCKQNKVFLNLKGKPILYYTLKVFEDNDNIDNIILVLSEADIEYCIDSVINKYGIKKVCKIVEGGTTRQSSVMNGLVAASECDLVLIHDGARPFIDNKIIDDGIKYAKIYGACACGVKPKDTIKIKSAEGFSEGTLKRDTLFSVQTPQGFKYDLILNSHKEAINKSIDATDDTALAEGSGHSVYLYEGSYTNIKITTPEDIIIGEKILYNSVNL